MGVSLWLVPSQADAECLRRLMRIRPHLTNQLQDASYPEFDPHITLASLPSESTISTDVLRASIPKSQARLTASFKAVETGQHYFRSVFIAIKPTPELLSLHQHIHATLGVEPRTPLYPHVSLCYITDEDAKHGERDKYFQELENQGRIRRSGSEQVSLDCGNPDCHQWLDGFSGSEIWITDCNGPVKDWKILEKLSLV